MMNDLLATVITAGAVATAALALAGHAAAAVSPEPSPVTTTITELKSRGYGVIVDRVGAAPMAACEISAVRPGHRVTRTDSGFPGDHLTTAVLSKTVFVDVRC